MFLKYIIIIVFICILNSLVILAGWGEYFLIYYFPNGNV